MYNSFLLESALNAAYNGIIIVDKDSKVVFCNDAAAKMIGLTKNEMFYQDIKKVNPHTQIEEVLKEGKEHLNKKVKLNSKVVITNRSPIFKNGEIEGAVAVFHDITDFQKTLNELANTKDALTKLETGLEQVSDGIVMVDNKGYITRITESYCEFLGTTCEKAVGKHVTEVIENTRMHQVIKTAKAELGHIQYINGKQVVVNRIPIVIEGKVVGGIGQVIFQEVSDLLKLVRRLDIAESKLEYYEKEVKRHKRTRYSLNNIIGESEKTSQMKNMIKKVAKYPSTVLVRGESGTGKELVAHAIHDESNRRDGPFVRVNCAAMPKDLLEAELFGYEEGAFTGAKKKGKPGKFELAEGGTIFLDEIGDMPLEMQVKLLRVLQEKEIERVGGTNLKIIDVRVIASTNRNLEELVAKKLFRKDLYYRLNVVTLKIPSLIEIREDMNNIVFYLLKELNSEYGTAVEKISPEVEELFLNYHWPGNVRELRNVLERAINIMDGIVVNLEDLPMYIQEYSYKNNANDTSNLNKTLQTSEKSTIIKALKAAGNNKKKAAKILNIHRTTLYRKIDKYNISV
ncbi:sigma 54-interacting transcriptional regulator [Natranaerofaba carboxydovora]|uniref:sigma 54-interacting transcriptional regulator n=1 Tax=Natranaerofaba carboxydovora TaxID=2742683 RepID=UPI001F138D52|nr:sigma 54-interacting transcriptional regulator [Natranaerofaba carboxydovora]UMZ72625.1 Limonene hydroxylase [Natranaerofaba carboxydovora]